MTMGENDLKKVLLVCTTILAGVALTGCGNSKQSSSSNSSSTTQTNNVDHKIASSSATLDSDNLTPKQNGALALYYSGVENKQSYVNQMNKQGQGVTINLYQAGSQPSSTGFSGTLPDGAEVLYYVKLNNGNGSTYYTIVGNQFYISNGHGGLRKAATDNANMVALANKNNAGDMINNLASNASLNDLRNGGSDESNSKDDQSGSMSFDEAADLIQKGGFSDFNYDRDSKTHDGSHATANGGYFMVTYPGAKGQDHYTITKVGKDKYHIKAEYGSSDGGFTLFPDQSSYGPTWWIIEWS